MPLLLDLFCTFFRIGLFTFGGGYAMLPLLQREIVEKKEWAAEEELLDYFSVGQCTPGIIAVNTATFVGYKKRGVLGAIFCTLGVVFPSLCIITVIAAFLKNFQDIIYVQQAFAGIRVALCALILDAIVKLWKKNVKSIWGIALFLVVLAVMILLDVSPILVVIGAAVVGIGLGKAGVKV